MFGFAEYLIEDKQGKNTHIQHLEDAILDDGPSGVNFAIGTLRAFGKMLDGGTVSRRLNVSVKWDGAPALVFGPDPADGRFFVATKHAAFAKTPKLAKTHSEIDRFYDSGVKRILHLALDELKSLNSSVVLQCDVLYTPDSVKSQAIEGTTYLTFQPNTILYAVDIVSDLGVRIQNSNIGIVIHTLYSGGGKRRINEDTINDLRATNITPSVFSQLKRTSRVVALDATYDDVSGTATFTDEEREDFVLALAKVEQLSGTIPRDLYAILLSEPIHSLLAQFLNAQVRENKSKSSPDDFIVWLSARQAKEAQARKTDAGKASVNKSFSELIGIVRTYRAKFTNLFTLHAAIQNAKNIVVQKLGQASRVSTFVPTSNGFKVTGPEGYVAVAHSGKAVKLVDRLEFSRLNFVAAKSWQ